MAKGEVLTALSRVEYNHKNQNKMKISLVGNLSSKEGK